MQTGGDRITTPRSQKGREWSQWQVKPLPPRLRESEGGGDKCMINKLIKARCYWASTLVHPLIVDYSCILDLQLYT